MLRSLYVSEMIYYVSDVSGMIYYVSDKSELIIEKSSWSRSNSSFKYKYPTTPSSAVA